MDPGAASLRPSGPQNWSNEEWESRRPMITRMYTTLKLKEVMEVMERDHGFKATKKQYEKRIEEWGIGKKVTETEKLWMLEKRKRRLEEEGKDTSFTLRHHPVGPQKLDRFEKEPAVKRIRMQKAEADLGSQLESLSARTPSQIKYHTPFNSHADACTPTQDPAPGHDFSLSLETDHEAMILDDYNLPSRDIEQNIFEWPLLEENLDHDVRMSIEPPIDQGDLEMRDPTPQEEAPDVDDPQQQTMTPLPCNPDEGVDATNYRELTPLDTDDEGLELLSARPLSLREKEPPPFYNVQPPEKKPPLILERQPAETNHAWVCLDRSHSPSTTSPPEEKFLLAAQRGDLQELRRCLGWFVSVDAVCDQGATAFHYASYMGHADIVRALVENGADAGLPLDGIIEHNGKLIENPTPLRLAAVMGQTEIVRILLHKAAALPRRNASTQSYLGDMEPAASLPWALAFGHTTIILLLVEHGAPLCITAYCGHTGPANPDSFLPVISQALDPEAGELEVPAGVGLACLNIAIKMDRNPTQAVANHGRDTEQSVLVNRPHQLGRDTTSHPTTVRISYSNFLCCVELGLISMIFQFAFFFEQQRDANGWTPLHHAIISGNAEVVRAMLSSPRNNPNIPTTAGFQPLHLAVGPAASPTQQEDIISVLLNHGAQINAPDPRGYTPLHIAAEYHCLPSLRALLSFGRLTNPLSEAANPNFTTTCYKRTPLDLALSGHGSLLEESTQISQTLLLAGADVNHPGCGGKTALHHAVRARNMPLIHLLLELSANCLAQDDTTKTPLHYAVDEPLLSTLDTNTHATQFHSESQPLSEEDSYPFTTSLQVLTQLFYSLTPSLQTSTIIAYGEALLTLAVSSQLVTCLSFLLNLGALTDCIKTPNLSLLWLAASKQSSKMVRIILHHSLSKGCPSPFPSTSSPLHENETSCYDPFLAVLQSFLGGDDEASLVRTEWMSIVQERGIEEKLYARAKELGFAGLVRIWDDRRGVGCCDPGRIFRASGSGV